MQSDCDDFEAAVMLGDIDECKRLMRNRGFYPSMCDLDIMKIACRLGRTEIVKLILRDPEIKTKKGLVSGVKGKHFKVAKLILQDPRTRLRQDEYESLINIARENRDWLTVDLLESSRRHGSKFDRHFKESLFESSVQNLDWKKVKELIKSDPNLSEEDYSLALGVATEHGETDFVRWLLKNTSADPFSGLGGSVYEHHPRILETLLKDKRMKYRSSDYEELLRHARNTSKNREFLNYDEIEDIDKTLELLETHRRN